MEHERSFSILDSVDSTNNYAMGMVHAGLAKHGQAWFAKDQTAGKGQRGNSWFSEPGENIILTVCLHPKSLFTAKNFYFTAFIALTCLKFLEKTTGEQFSIKWPNDLNWNDRKAGGILIENVIQGGDWRWSVVGMGINLNQVNFPPDLKNPVSLAQITGLRYDAIQLARELHAAIVDDLGRLSAPEILLEEYNNHLYQKEKNVKLKKGNGSFVTKIKGVDAFGNLHTEDTLERSFTFGEVSWV